MPGYVLSPRAVRDLEEVWTYTRQRWSVDQADRYVAQLVDGFEFIAAEPRRGVACDDIRPGYRKYGVVSHVIFFRELASGIDIVRSLHGRMDFRRHL